MSFIYFRPHPARERVLKSQHGFTLLEMVLVLLIMGMVASLSVVFIDNEDNQLRYEETIQKLETMHKATVNIKEYGSGFLFSGFVVDNGKLPSQAKHYVSLPAGWTERKLFNNSDKAKYRIKDTTTPHNGIKDISLYKGYRLGYISLKTDSTGDFKTGWGEPFIVAEQSSTNILQLSYDESLNPPEYDSPVNKNIPADNWGITLSEVNVTVKNSRGSDISAPVYVGLILFKNIQTDLTDTDKSNDSVWQTYHFKLDTLTGTNPDPDQNTHNTINDTTSWLSEAGTNAAATRIPAGEHIIFVGVDGGADGSTPNEKIENNDSNNDGDYDDFGEFKELKDQSTFKVIPRFTQPATTLVIND